MGRPCEFQVAGRGPISAERGARTLWARRGRGRRRDLVGVEAGDLGVVHLALIPRLTSLRDHLCHLPAREPTGVTAPPARARHASEPVAVFVQLLDQRVEVGEGVGGGRGVCGWVGGQHRLELVDELGRVRPADACSRRKVRDLRVARGDILSFRHPC